MAKCQPHPDHRDQTDNRNPHVCCAAPRTPSLSANIISPAASNQPHRGPMRHPVHSGIIFVTALLCIHLLSGAQAPLASANGTPRKPAPNFTRNDSKGAPINLASYKGKVVLLNFWASWCHGCVQEMPWFMEFRSEE